MKINFKMLGKATWEIMKLPLLILLIITSITSSTVALFYCFGPMAFPILLALTVIGLFGFLITMRYKDMMVAHRKEQQNLVDILSR